MRALEESAQQSQSQPQGQQQSPSVPATKAVKTFEQMDTNADGRLSSSEAQGSVKDGFAKLDSNKDGYLTKAEVEGTSSTKRRTDKRPGGK